jgi:hypothetical protein
VDGSMVFYMVVRRRLIEKGRDRKYLLKYKAGLCLGVVLNHNYHIVRWLNPGKLNY